MPWRSSSDGKSRQARVFQPSANGCRPTGDEKTGRQLSADDALRLAIHDVSRDFIASIEQAGYKGVDVEDLVKMRIHGVSPQFIRELKELGYGSVPADRLVQFRIHGVDAQFIREVQKAGMKDMSPQDLVDSSIHGGRRWLSRMR